MSKMRWLIYGSHCDACGERLPVHGGYMSNKGAACTKKCLQKVNEGMCKDRTPEWIAHLYARLPKVRRRWRHD